MSTLSPLAFRAISKVEDVKIPLPLQFTAALKVQSEAVNAAVFAVVTAPVIVPLRSSSFADFMTVSFPMVLPFASILKSPLSTLSVPAASASSLSVQPL